VHRAARDAPREGESYLAVEAHAREPPEHVRDAAIDIAAIDIADPDARVIATPGARGPNWAQPRGPKTKTQPGRLRKSCAKGDSNPVKTSHQLLESRGLAVVFIG
jgi:hypothetical protein